MLLIFLNLCIFIYVLLQMPTRRRIFLHVVLYPVHQFLLPALLLCVNLNSNTALRWEWQNLNYVLQMKHLNTSAQHWISLDAKCLLLLQCVKITKGLSQLFLPIKLQKGYTMWSCITSAYLIGSNKGIYLSFPSPPVTILPIHLEKVLDLNFTHNTIRLFLVDVNRSTVPSRTFCSIYSILLRFIATNTVMLFTSPIFNAIAWNN